MAEVRRRPHRCRPSPQTRKLPLKPGGCAPRCRWAGLKGSGVVRVVSKRPFVSPFQYHAQNKAKLISETRRRFEAEYVTGGYRVLDVEADKPDKYDPRDVERLQQDDNWVESYLLWRHSVVDETLKMLDESFQWRKEMCVNDLTESSIPRWLLEIGSIYLHGYDKEGNKLFWIRVKYHVKDHKTMLDKKKLIAFWLERYAKRENGKPVTVMFDLSETGINSI
ncbi:hypothetical protein GH733_019210, partial [Mirounga leonina]